MQHVRLIENPLEPATWDEVDVPDVRAFLVERFATWPAGARIYAGGVGDDHDVTPATPGDVERLATFDDLTVIVFPEGPALLIAALVVAVVAVIAMLFLLPAIPDLSNTQTSSGNNSLSERTNRPRPNARIPDIFGQVRSIPDQIAFPYRVYENHHQLEISFMCIGRGAYAIDDVRDGDTLVADILGSSVAVYGPNTSPNDFSTPQLQIGSPISDPVFNCSRLNDVNGQTLKAPNDISVKADQEIKFKDGGIIEAAGGDIDFTDYFTAGDLITVGNGNDTGLTAPPVAIFAAATGVAPNIFRFASYDPTDDFSVGQRIVIGQALYMTTTGGGGGDIGGGVGGGGPENPDYPYDLFPTPPTVEG
jgi:hypothetical protein